MAELVLRIIFSLAIVAGLLWTIARVLRKPMAKKAAGAMSVLARQQLGRNVSVAVIRVADQAFVVGVTEQQISMLAETDLVAVEEAIAANGPERRSSVRVDDLAAIEPASADVAAMTENAASESELVNVSIALDEPSEADGPRTRGRHAAAPVKADPQGALAGSALSPQTWMQTVEFLRSRTARRA